MRRKTHEEFVLELKNKKPNLKVISRYKNSRSKVKIECLKCGYIWEPIANSIVVTDCNCPRCSGVAKLTFEDINTLTSSKQLYLFENDFPEDFNSKTKFKVLCKRCNYIFETTYNGLKSKKYGCPCCTNKITVRGINDLWTTNPEIAELLLCKDDGYNYTYGSSKIVKWKCPFCGNIIKKSFSEVYQNGLKCMKCSDNISYPEKFIMNLLDDVGVKSINSIKLC